ncbi:hypothetical protein CY35_03G074800 [Sphagnum magellanicum]|nr:hypothetical protein CY35_03G074800 [Sphagnum magellanicum]
MGTITVVGVVLVAVMAWYVATDPFKISISSNFPEFKPQTIPMPPYDPARNFTRDNQNRLQQAEVKWKDEFVGPESIAFDLQGRGPYTGVSDGRVIRWDGPELGWTTFATTSNKRSEICDYSNPPVEKPQYEHICGRPLGLRFNKKTGELFIADGYFGLMKVAPDGGLAEPVVQEFDGVQFKFLNSLDFDEDGIIYFTDSSSKYYRRHFFVAFLEADNSGRFLKYDPSTRKTTVLIDGLQFPNGVRVSKDGTFVVFAETRGSRLLRYWLKGPKAGTSDTFVDNLPGISDNLDCNEKGEFWVPLHNLYTPLDIYVAVQPWFRHTLGRLPIAEKYLFKLVTMIPQAAVLRYSAEGELLEVLEDKTGKSVKYLSDAQEHNGKLYLGSLHSPNLCVFTLPSSV